MKTALHYQGIVLSLLMLILAPGVRADIDSELHTVRVQLRQSEEERAALRADIAQLEQRLAEREEELSMYVERERRILQQIVSVEAAAERRTAAGAGRQRMRQVEVAALREESVRYAQAVENLRQLLAGQNEKLALGEELMALCRARNQELYDIGHEVVNFYKRDDMQNPGRREPVLQLRRVAMENALQDFEARLREQRVYEDTLPPSLERAMMEELERRRTQEPEAEQHTGAPPSEAETAAEAE